MATRKSLVIVSGLFQELNPSSDKLDFAGNTTADLSENTNLYYTNARARSAISITDSGGDGSLAYNNSTGAITYTGPSASEVRAHISVASGSGLTYSSGEIGTSSIPNSQLANSSVTLGSTAVALGATVTTFAGISSLSGTSITGTNFYTGVAGATNTLSITGATIIFEGATADAYETTLTSSDATADRTITLPDNTGTVLTTGTSIANSNLANSSVTIGSTSLSLGVTSATLAGLTSLTATTLYAGTDAAANTISIGSGNVTFEGATADAYEIALTAADATADRTITLPNATGTIALLNTLSAASGSGLTYNSGTGEIGTSSIPNSQLANSSVTVGSTGIALGNTATTITGLSSITSTAVVTDDSGFRIRDNSDNTKQLAFECSGISGSTTRTLTAPDVSGTLTLIDASQTLTNKTLTSAVLNSTISGTSIKDEDNMASDSASHLATQQSIKAYVDTQITAEDLDIQTDSGNIDIDLDSEALVLTGGTGIDTSATGTTVTYAIDNTVATLAGTQTLTNKTLTSPTVSGLYLSDASLTFEGATADAYETVLAATDPTADRTLTLPDATDTLIGRDTSDTITNKTLTSAVLNSTISGTSIKDEDDMASNSASHLATQQSIKSYVDTKVTAEDLDIQTDSGSISIDLDSATLVLTGGTGIDTSATGSTVTYAIDSTVATLAGTQTLTNKSITGPTITGTITATSAVFAGASPLVFEGATSNAYETTLAVTDPTADRTLTLPDETGNVATESFATAIAVALG